MGIFKKEDFSPQPPHFWGKDGWGIEVWEKATMGELKQEDPLGGYHNNLSEKGWRLRRARWQWWRDWDRYRQQHQQDPIVDWMRGGREKEEKVCGVSSQRMVLPLPEKRERMGTGVPSSLKHAKFQVPLGHPRRYWRVECSWVTRSSGVRSSWRPKSGGIRTYLKPKWAHLSAYRGGGKGPKAKPLDIPAVRGREEDAHPAFHPGDGTASVLEENRKMWRPESQILKRVSGRNRSHCQILLISEGRRRFKTDYWSWQHGGHRWSWKEEFSWRREIKVWLEWI